MQDESTDLEGPDLNEGVELDRLREGEPLLGHADGEAVLLFRQGDQVFAVGATCPHYGAPLIEGLVVDDTIRCPWHHACLSLRTGEALGPPALSPLARWDVAVQGGVVRLGRKHQADPLDDRGRTASGPSSVVIVGAGAAGSAAAEMLRREGYRGPIIMVDPDEAAPYDRPNLSKDYLAGEAPEEWIPLRPEHFYAEHEIERVSASVVALDPDSRSITLDNGQQMRYGALLLATGASPIRLEIPGVDQRHVYTLRSLADCRAIIAAAEKSSEAVVLGASFIGMEVTAALRNLGIEVTVVAPDSVPFERTLGVELGGLLQRAHEENRVQFRLGRTAATILEDRVRLDDGSEIEADLVIMGVGVRPDLRLAEDAGLEVDGGLVVDAYLQASAPGIFGAGDIARWPDPRIGERIRVEHWAVAQRQGQTAARNILGRGVRFDYVPFFWTRQYDINIRYVGHAAKWARVEVDGDLSARDCTVRYFRGDRLLGAATIGRDQESLRVEAALEAQAAALTPSVERSDESA